MVGSDSALLACQVFISLHFIDDVVVVSNVKNCVGGFYLHFVDDDLQPNLLHLSFLDVRRVVDMGSTKS
jgi:hypothetical protein